jgi:hypothetical protein
VCIYQLQFCEAAFKATMSTVMVMVMAMVMVMVVVMVNGDGNWW